MPKTKHQETNTAESVSESVNEQIYDQELFEAISNLKLICSYKKIPMYAILALNEGGTTTYIRECIYASLDLSKREERIANLILAAKNGEERLPVHIEKCIQDLNTYIESRQAIQQRRENLNLPLADDQIQRMAEIGDGFLGIKPPQEILTGGIRYDEDLDSLPDYERGGADTN